MSRSGDAGTYVGVVGVTGAIAVDGRGVDRGRVGTRRRLEVVRSARGS